MEIIEFFKSLLVNSSDKWHAVRVGKVYEKEEKPAGKKVWFTTMEVEVHEETGEHRFTESLSGEPQFYTESDWEIATIGNGRYRYEGDVITIDRFESAVPKGEWKQKMLDKFGADTFRNS